ncbi:hypothetical protein A3850_001055 [Lewinella sp. 4G2]|nr:hypothetical protein A3850_001055 [Lewinella sp. 4G2]
MTQYTEQLSIINPASLSTEFMTYNLKQSAAVSYRHQLTGIEDAPRTGYARYDRIIESNSLMAFGAQLTYDRVGPTSQTAFHARYAYLINPGGSYFYVGGGLKLGLVQFSIAANDLEFADGDPAAGDFGGKILLDAHFGFSVAYLPKRGLKWYAGASVPQALGNTIEYERENEKGEAVILNFKRLRYATLHGGLLIPVGEKGYLEPTFWLRQAKDLPITVDFNLRQQYANKLWVGAGYSTARILHFEGGLILQEQLRMQTGAIRIGYGFDYSTAAISPFFGTTHELNITYMWDKNRRLKRSKDSPR